MCVSVCVFSEHKSMDEGMVFPLLKYKAFHVCSLEVLLPVAFVIMIASRWNVNYKK